MIPVEHLIVPIATFMSWGTGDDSDASSTEKNREAGAGLGLRVLIVEDEALVAINMESALAEAGFEIAGIVDTGAEAIAEALRLRPDIILMDITLRDGDGIAAAKSIREELKVHIVFVSGNSDSRTLAAADRANPAGFIRKPFVTDRLANLVLDAIAQK